MRVRFAELAKIEFDEARIWYQNIRPELGRAFTAEVRTATQRVAHMPLMYPLEIGDVRRCVLRQCVKAGASFHHQTGHARGTAQQFQPRHQRHLPRARHLGTRPVELRRLDAAVATEPGLKGAFAAAFGFSRPVGWGWVAGTGGHSKTER